MQYKVGDVVRIRKDLDTVFTGKRAWAGKLMTVKEVYRYYIMKEDRENNVAWAWHDDDFEGLAEPEKENTMKYKVGDEVILKTDFAGRAAKFNGAHATITHVFPGLSYVVETILDGEKHGIYLDDDNIAGPAESEKQRAMARLYCLITEINSKEITSHIAYDTLSRWCNDWRVAAKEALRALGED